ncbi:MAG TPA: phosphohistidine phosphatase SixA [Abditibacterium sp.]|jgi:phosphohistidine phosphatase
MLLLLMRHGVAQPLDDDLVDDFHRPLTREGRARAKQAARGLKKLVTRLDFVASSPKSRARATAQIVSDIYGKAAPKVTEWPELMAGDGEKIIGKISGLNTKTLLLCGHEPHLSELSAQLLTGSAGGMTISFKKAGVMALEVDPRGAATLLWHLTPSQLRRIGR